MSRIWSLTLSGFCGRLAMFFACVTANISTVAASGTTAGTWTAGTRTGTEMLHAKAAVHRGPWQRLGSW